MVDSESAAPRRAAPAQLAVRVAKMQAQQQPTSRTVPVRWPALEVQLPIGIKGESGSGLRSKTPRVRSAYVRARVYDPPTL